MEEQGALTKKRNEQSLNLKEMIFKYLRYLPLYVLCVSLALLGAYMYLRYATEYYRSSGQIIIRDERSGGGGSRSELEEALQSDNRKNIQTEIEVLQSRTLMERAVTALDLNFAYTIIGKVKELDAYGRTPVLLQALRLTDSTSAFVLNLKFPDQQHVSVNGAAPVAFEQPFQNQFGEFKFLRLNQNVVPEEMRINYSTTAARAGTLLGGIVVVPKQNTGILTILMEATNPQLAADVINALMSEYQAITIEEKNASTRKSLDFIDQNLRVRAKELDSITLALVSYQKANNIIDPATQASNYYSRVESAHEEEQQQRMQLNNAVQLQDYLRSNQQSPVPSSLGLADPTLNSLVGNYNTAQLERKALLENAQPGHIIVKQKEEEIEALRSKMLENIKNIRTAYSQAIGTLQASSGQAVAQIRNMPTKSQELQTIQNQLEGKMRLYNEMLSKRDLSAVTLASTISNIKVMQPAVPNGTPVKPDRRTTRIVALLLGMLIPTVIIVGIELLNDKVNSRSDVERLTDVPILGEVGHSYGEKTLVVTSGNRRVIAEQFRILRSNLQYVLTKAPRPVILVSSSFSGEGKSFISTNMGAVMALANKRTIVLEFDIRKPKLVAGLGISKQPGLTNFILGQVKAEELPVKVDGYNNFFVLPCGPIPPNPAELLLDSKLEELFTYLKANFEIVIMDTAPVGMVSDALTLSRFADCTLYIVRQGHTFKKQVSLIDDFHRQGKLPKVSIVINDMKIRSGSYGAYGYGGNYGYGYGYGAGYFEEENVTHSRFEKWFGWLGIKNGKATKKTKENV